MNAVRKPIQDFIHTQQIGAIILLLGAVAALGWVNSPWAHTYEDFWHTHVAFDIHIFAISEDLKHLVNDGLMAVFFFLVGLEIRRELRDGELSTFRKAALPAFAAVGGMVVPAAVYLLFNASGEGAVGWGIPMATDIAFALGVLALVGKHIPAELRVFLLGLAVVDDLGAIAVIATFYTETIDWVHLGLAVGMFVVIWGCIRLGIHSLGFLHHLVCADVAVPARIGDSCDACGRGGGGDRALRAGPAAQGLPKSGRAFVARFRAGDWSGATWRRRSRSRSRSRS